MNIKMATNAPLSATESKKLSKQAEQEQNHKYGDRSEGYQLGGENGENVQGIRRINGRYKIDRGMLRAV